MFNALKYIRSLEAAGFQREQAEAQVQLVYEAIGEEVATKSDMAAFKAEVKAEISSLRGELHSEVSGLRAEISDLKSEIVYKIGALMIASTTVTTAILGILISFIAL